MIIIIVLILIFFLIYIIGNILRLHFLLYSKYDSLSVKDQRERIKIKLKLKKYGISL